MKTQVVVQVTTLSTALALAMLVPTAFAQTLPAAGATNSGTATLTGSRTTAGAYPNERRMFAFHPTVVVPRRSYVTSCLSGGTRKIFASFTSRNTSGGTEGMIISANVETSGAVTGFSQKVFASECLDMAGITADSSCSVVAALCKRPSNAPVLSPDLDLVARIRNDSWGNKFRAALTADPADNRMWLYEWTGSPANPTGTAPAKRYVVAKNIRSTATWKPADGPFVETGHHSLAFSPAATASNGLPASDSLYAISMSTTGATGTDGVKHDGDKFVVVRRTATPSIDLDRGWIDSCGIGHPRTNRVAMRRSTNSNEIYPTKFSVLCSTDWDGVANSKKAGIWMRTEGGAVGVPLQAGRLAHTLYTKSGVTDYTNYINGGGGALVATATGYLGVIVGNDTTTTAVRSRIGLVTFDAFGAKVGATRWVKSSADYYMGYPQLVQIGFEANGTTPRYLLGWAEMMAAPSTFTAAQVAAAFNSPTPDNTQRVATHYYVQEIDSVGTAKAAVKSLVHGWGEQDQMVALGRGKAAWVYRPDSTIKLTTTGTLVPSTTAVPNPPSPYSTSLIFMTYTSSNLTPTSP